MSAILTNTGSILTALLGMMTQILAWIIEEPVVMFYLGFSVIGLVFVYARKMKGF